MAFGKVVKAGFAKVGGGAKKAAPVVARKPVGKGVRKALPRRRAY